MSTQSVMYPAVIQSIDSQKLQADILRYPTNAIILGATIGSQYFSKEKGSSLLPNVGDVVLVAEGQYIKPVIICSLEAMYTSDVKTHLLPGENNFENSFNSWFKQNTNGDVLLGSQNGSRFVLGESARQISSSEENVLTAKITTPRAYADVYSDINELRGILSEYNNFILNDININTPSEILDKTALLKNSLQPFISTPYFLRESFKCKNVVDVLNEIIHKGDINPKQLYEYIDIYGSSIKKINDSWISGRLMISGISYASDSPSGNVILYINGIQDNLIPLPKENMTAEYKLSVTYSTVNENLSPSMDKTRDFSNTIENKFLGWYSKQTGEFVYNKNPKYINQSVVRSIDQDVFLNHDAFLENIEYLNPLYPDDLENSPSFGTSLKIYLNFLGADPSWYGKKIDWSGYIDIMIQYNQSLSNPSQDQFLESDKTEYELTAPYDLPRNNKNLFDLVYPVGSIYLSASDVNPGLIFGGTWVSWGAGQFPVGYKENDGDFGVVEKTGGEAINSSLNCGSSAYGLYGPATAAYSNRTIVRSSAINNTHNEINAEISNLPPYIVCFMWKRTA